MITRAFLFLCAITLSFDAAAYIDPGSGSVLIQGLIATIAAVGVTLKLYWHRLLAFFGKKDVHEPAANAEVDDDPTRS